MSARILCVVAAAAFATVSVSAEKCCSTHSAHVPLNTSNADDIGCSGALPLSYWNPVVNDDAPQHWLQGDKPTWLSFAGDSELRYEFWALVRMIGKESFTASSNFATVAFNASNAGAMRKMLADGDPVTVEAKYMDYRFCCASPSNPASCHIETGGDNVTKLHAGYRKVNYWVSQYTDFTDLGAATSDFLERNPSGLCITWKMVAYPIPEVIYPLLTSQLEQREPPTALVLNPGLHHLCFKGNARGSEGHVAHLNGFKLFKDLLNARQTAGTLHTKVIMHNVLWANEEGLYDAFAARNIMDKAQTFRGLHAGIKNWNKDAKQVLGSKPAMVLMDLYVLSERMKHLIKKDHVHFMPPMYEAALTFDLNVMFGNVDMCREF